MNQKIFGPEIGNSLSNIYHWSIEVDGNSLQPVPPKAELPAFVVERIQYFYQFMEEGLSFEKCFSLILSDRLIDETINEFEEYFADYEAPSSEFIDWRDNSGVKSFHEMEIAVALIYGTTN